MKLGFLTSKTLAPVAEPMKEREAPLPVNLHARLFGLHDELKARFPGCKVSIMMFHRDTSFGDKPYHCFQIEIEGKRPNGTEVSFKVEATRKGNETEREPLARLFHEVDSWT